MGVSHFWTFSGHMMDFKLEALEYLEETTGPTITLRIQNLDIPLPASWTLMAVDMETSALFTVAGFLGIAAAAVLVVSDDLSTLSWRPGFKRPEFRRGCEQACRDLLAALG